MATSRTGTAMWLNVCKKRRAFDMEAGVTHCTECRTWLDWIYSRRPNSAETDHVTPHAIGGPDTFENSRTICRRCNQSLGGKLGKQRSRKRAPVKTIDLGVSGVW